MITNQGTRLQFGNIFGDMMGIYIYIIFAVRILYIISNAIYWTSKCGWTKLVGVRVRLRHNGSVGETAPIDTPTWVDPLNGNLINVDSIVDPNDNNAACPKDDIYLRFIYIYKYDDEVAHSETEGHLARHLVSLSLCVRFSP